MIDQQNQRNVVDNWSVINVTSVIRVGRNTWDTADFRQLHQRYYSRSRKFPIHQQMLIV